MKLHLYALHAVYVKNAVIEERKTREKIKEAFAEVIFVIVNKGCYELTTKSC